MRIAIATLGCKANQYDSEIIRETFEERHCEIVPFSEGADVYVINTCTVTGKTDYQSRQLVRRAHRLNPEAKIVVTGCYAQVAADETRNIPGVSMVVGNREKERIAEFVACASPDSETRILVPAMSGNIGFSEKSVRRFGSRTRFFLKIQDGCDARCTYCIIPRARGRSRSMAPEKFLELIGKSKSSGYNEVVLTGIHLGAYGLDLTPPTSLTKLLKMSEKEKPIGRLRLSSIEPNEISGELIDLLARSEIVCPHLHIPFQSGDDAILRRMNRLYAADDLRELTLKLTRAIPDLAIGVDVIVGFPGEGEAEFKRTAELLEELPIAYLHVFPFSPRKGTPAIHFPGRVDGNTVKQRGKLLRSLSSKKRTAFYQSYLNREVKVLVETKREKKAGLFKGLSRNYIPVLIDGGEEFINEEVTVRVASVANEIVRGVIV